MFNRQMCISITHHPVHITIQTNVTTTTTTIWWPLYRSTWVSLHLQLRTGGFFWCKVLLPACLCLGMVELCAKNLKIMRNDFTDYARTFCQIFANYAHFLRIMRKLCATILKIMRALSHFFANYAHLPRKVVNNDVSSELPTISK